MFYDIFRSVGGQWHLYDRVHAPSRRAACRQVNSLMRGKVKVRLASQQVSIKTGGEA